MNNMERLYLEEWADQLDALARDKTVRTLVGEKEMKRNELHGIAWDIRQEARRGTPSFGI